MNKTESICPKCLEKVEAEIRQEEDKIVIEKKCKEHGFFSIPHWQSAKIFNYVEKFDYFKHYAKNADPIENSKCPFSCGLCNNHLSQTVIAVIDLTKRCDLDCSVCFASFPEHETEYEPSKNEILKMLEFLSHLNPKPPAVLFSGGEPLLREDLAEIIRFAHKLGFLTILATNGLRIAKSPSLAAKLKESGLNIVYLQFDSLKDEVYKELRGRALLKEKLKVIEVCRQYDIEVILVPTLINGINNGEIGDIIRFAAENSHIVRGLVFQPIAFTGKAANSHLINAWTDSAFAEEVEKQTLNEIRAEDFFPVSIMAPPITVMRKFMKKPWPLFSCSPHCGVVNWIYVSKNGRLIPLNKLLNFEKFFGTLLKLSKTIDSKGKAQILLTLLFAAVRSLNWGVVQREVGIITFFKTVLRVHVSPTYRSLGSIRRRMFLLGCMAFMDRYNFDINRVKRCVIHYVTPDLKRIPFCTYNNIYRTTIEAEHPKKAVKAKAKLP
ncbi:MAG: radical SAM protein [Candidatus Bathyarchaeota archaeon]|nr:radical SAM protein [Candidatus Bathyarchaeota archaeon]MDW8040610.1 radical SAM protein [Nitrososphaerota archaeon]